MSCCRMKNGLLAACRNGDAELNAVGCNEIFMQSQIGILQ